MGADHSLRHPTYTEDCYLCKLRSVSVASAATPSRSGAMRSNQTQAIADKWDKDIPAYKRLVKGGIQPETSDGAYELEKKVDAGEVARAGQ